MVREKYLQQVKKIIGSDHKINPKLLDYHVEHHKIFDLIRTPGPSIYYLFNTNTLNFEYMSPGFEELTGYKIEEITFSDEGKFLDLIHPDDVPILVHQVYADIRNTISDFTVAEKRKLTIELNYRVLKKNGQSYYNLEQLNYLEFDKAGNPVLEFGKSTKIITNTTIHLVAAIHILDKGSYDHVFHKIYPRKNDPKSVSKREKEILRLLTAGKTSKEIA